MTDELFYKRLLITRDKQLELLLKLEAEGSDQKKIAKAAKQLLSLTETINEMEKQRNEQ